MAKFYVYVHCKPDGTPFYVGKGNQERIKYIVRGNQYHINVVAKYGLENIQVITYPCSSEKEAFSLEIEMIRILRDEMGHSLAKRITPESRVKAKATLRIRIEEGSVNPGLPEGFEYTEGMKRKISEAAKKMHAERSVEEKDRISKLLAESGTGRRHTEEAKEKNRLWHLGRKQTHATKKLRAEALTGLKRSEETKALMALKAQAREAKKKLERELGTAPTHPNKGRKYTEEQRQQMKLSAQKWRAEKKAKESQNNAPST